MMRPMGAPVASSERRAVRTSGENFGVSRAAAAGGGGGGTGMGAHRRWGDGKQGGGGATTGWERGG
jgi:hypothetical protein